MSYAYWQNAHRTSYQYKDWIDKPTIFVQQIISYLPASGRLLDLAAGQGQDSRYFASRGFEVVSTDFCDEALELSQQKTDKAGLKMQIQKVDLAEPLPFANQSFNVVYSHLGLHYFNKEKTRDLFKEIYRVLKPNGFLAALFNTMDDPEINTAGFEKIEDHYYNETATGLHKAYFTVDYAREMINGLFQPLLLDNQGETYKDRIKVLIRLVAKVIS